MEGIETRVGMRSERIMLDQLISVLREDVWLTVAGIIKRIDATIDVGALDVVKRVRMLLRGLEILGVVKGRSIRSVDAKEMSLFASGDELKVAKRCRENNIDFDFLYCLGGDDQRFKESEVLDAATF